MRDIAGFVYEVVSMFVLVGIATLFALGAWIAVTVGTVVLAFSWR